MALVMVLITADRHSTGGGQQQVSGTTAPTCTTGRQVQALIPSNFTPVFRCTKPYNRDCLLCGG